MIEYDDLCPLYQVAGQKNFWKGFYYYECGFVKKCTQLDENTYQCEVAGSNDNVYQIILRIDKIKLSTCTCPYCKDHPMRFCKHKVAAYLAIFPEEYQAVKKLHDDLIFENNQRMEEIENRLQQIHKERRERIKQEVSKMTPEEIKEQLINILCNESTSYEEDCLNEEYEEYLNDW